MINQELSYMKFETLSEETRIKNGLKPTTVNRLDCTTAYFHDNNYRGFDFFFNRKGMLFLYKDEPRDFISCDARRFGDKALTKNVKGNGYNISSIYTENQDFKKFGYGYSPKIQFLGKDKNKANPMFAYKDDLFLFISTHEYDQVELIIIPYKRNLSHQYFVKLWQGELNEQIEYLRMNSNTFYNYECV